jgi:glycosyltransferase involved in cell wall biosynthesis
MRVAVNAIPLETPHLRGWTRYTINLLTALPAHGVRLVLLGRAPPHPDHLAKLPASSFEVRVAPAMSYPRWEQRWVPRECRQGGVDVYHCPLNFGVPAFSPVPRVLTLHDAIDPIYYAPRLRWRERWSSKVVKSRLYHWIARRFADHVVTVSAHAKGDLVKHLGLSPERITVVHEAADPGFHAPLTESDRAVVRTKWGLDRPYFFYVGGWEGRKNLPFLLRGFAAAGTDGIELVLAGGKDERRGDLTRLAESLGIADRLRLLGYVPDGDLPALYAAALGFVYPSEYEGFGLQLVEAMAVGCPVLAARATCLPEVLATGGETFALGDPGELAALLKRLATDPGFRADLASRAGRRSADFSWDKAAAETVAVYRRVLA